MKKFVWYVLLVIGIGSLMLISEAVYTIRHRPEVMQTFYLVLAKQVAQADRIQESMKLLEKSAQNTIYSNAKKYPVYDQENYPKVNYDSSNLEFQKEYKNYIAYIPNFSLSQDKTQHIAKIFYDLGLVAYKTGEKNMAVYFMKNAVFLEPFFSYYHVELANYYLAEGNVDQAENAIKFCLNFGVTEEHCNEYQNDNLRINYPDDVGFLKQKVEMFIK
jgi:tetratricopeptide (TPR) repeat protein